MISFFLRICDWHVAKSKVCDFWQFFTPFNYTCGISHKWMYLFSRSGCFQMWWVRHLPIKFSLGSSREHPSSKGGSRGHAFLKKKLEILGLSLYSWKFWRKKTSSPEILQNCYKLSKFQAQQKPRPLEISHDFFLITPENSTSFLIEPWNFYMLFLQYPWKFHVLNLPCLDFCWKSLLGDHKVFPDYFTH